MMVRTLVVVTALAMTGTAAGQTANGGAHERETADFLARLQRAVDDRDRSAVSRLFDFPATILASGLRIPIQNGQALAQMYDSVFTPEMRCRIDQSGIARQGSPAPTFPVVSSNDGLVLGDGLLWATRVRDQWKLTRVVVPPSFAPDQRTRPKPRELRLQKGTAGARVSSWSDWLSRDETHVYSVPLAPGDFLDVRLDGFQGLAAAVFVVRPDSNKAPGNETPTRRRTVRITEVGAYDIKVVRLTTYCAPRFQYRLFVTVSR